MCGITGYKHGCKCAVCRAAQAEYMRRYRRGQRTRVSSVDTLRHVARLQAAGMCLEAIAKAAGIRPQTVRQIVSNQRPTVWPRTADALLAVMTDALPAHTIVPKEAALRLIDEMKRAGVCSEAIADSIGWRDCSRWHGMREVTLRKVRVLYELLARQGRVPADLLEAVDS